MTRLRLKEGSYRIVLNDVVHDLQPGDEIEIPRLKIKPSKLRRFINVDELEEEQKKDKELKDALKAMAKRIKDLEKKQK